MVKRKEAIHCRQHTPKSPEHIEKVAAANRGLKRSPETKAKLSEIWKRKSEQRGTTTHRTCPVCLIPFSTEKPSSKVRFCSRACGYAQRKGENAVNWIDIPMVSCAVCGLEFRPPTRTLKRICCSYNCKNIYQLKRQKNKRTNIERVMEAAMIARGWQFIAQHPIGNISIPDFYLPTINVAVFCDGDYWHSKPEKRTSDLEKTAKIEATGVKVFRFWGSQILHNVTACLDQIPHP